MRFLNEEKILSSQIGVLDNNSEWLGIPKTHLMECAGYSVASEILDKYNLGIDDKVLIFCGTGNNGGDGFVVARHLSSFGVKSKVILLGHPERIRTDEALLNWNIISKSLTYSIEIQVIKDSTDVVGLGVLLDKDHNFKVIIDAMLGTGIKGKIREPISTAIEFIEEIRIHQPIPVVSVDVPSGLNPDTGEVIDKAIHADLVITFHRNKMGMKVDNKYINEIIVKSIGIPEEASLFLGKGDLLPTLKKRKSDTHKGEFGKMLVIGGSKNYSGAPAFCSLTGINFGLDLVITFVPSVIADILRSYSPNMIVRSQPGEWLSLEAYKELEELIDWANVILIGPGIGEDKETEKLLSKLLTKFREDNKQFVLDADAIKLSKNHHELLKGQNCILTPHVGELDIFAGTKLPAYEQIENRAAKIHELAKKLDITILVKGPYDYVSNGRQTRVNKTGCPEMSVGGTGDVLAGLCASFLATDNNIFQSACSAVFLNGYVGEYCKSKLGPRFTALDMVNNLDKVLSELKKK